MPERSSTLKTILIGVTTTVLGAIILYFLGFQTRSKTLPSLAMDISTERDAEQLEQFVDQNRGKLVHLNIAIVSELSEIGADRKEIEIATDPACRASNPFYLCIGFRLDINGDAFGIGWNSGHNVLNGFFWIDENREMHQGTTYTLRAVPPESIPANVR